MLRASHLANQPLRLVETEGGVCHLMLASNSGPPFRVLCARSVVGRVRPDWVDDWLRSALTPCPHCVALYHDARRWRPR